MKKKSPSVEVVEDEEEMEWEEAEEGAEEEEAGPEDEGSEEEGAEDAEELEEGPPKKKSNPSSGAKGKAKDKAPKASSKKKAGPGGLRKNKWFMWTLRIVTVIVVMLLLFAPFKPFTQFRDAMGLDSLSNLVRPFREFPEWVNVTIEAVYTLSISGGTADEVVIQFAPPYDLPSESDEDRENFVVQDVHSVAPFPATARPVMDWNEDKNEVAEWELTDGQGPYQFRVTSELTLYTYEWDITEEESGVETDIPEVLKEKYLDDDWPVEDGGEIRDLDHDGVPDLYRYHPNAPKIKSTAESITKDETTVLGKVRAIYDWMHEHFNYTNSEQRERDQDVYGDYPKWALGCLSDWYGDCDDQSLLMASFCRAVGIPAWLEIGYLYDPVRDEWGGHGWFNVMIPVRTDTGFKMVVTPIDPVNSEFLFRDPYRITDWIDNGGDMIDREGEAVFNLDFYYNFFSVRRSSGVDVEIDLVVNPVQYEGHGKVKKYVDEKIDAGNLPGSEQTIGALPAPSPLLLLPLSFLLIVPAIRSRFSKR